MVPCVLELGGKSAAIVHDDADLEAFENDIRWGIYFNAGQVCSAMSRVVVHESRHDEVVERAVKVAKSLSVGPGADRAEAGVNMGSMVSEAQRDRAADMVTEAERHRSIVEQAVAAEAAGFVSVHLGEHHFSEYILSSPALVLAAIAERTTELRLSNGVALAGNLDPIRLAED